MTLFTRSLRRVVPLWYCSHKRRHAALVLHTKCEHGFKVHRIEAITAWSLHVLHHYQTITKDRGFLYAHAVSEVNKPQPRGSYGHLWHSSGDDDEYDDEEQQQQQQQQQPDQATTAVTSDNTRPSFSTPFTFCPSFSSPAFSCPAFSVTPRTMLSQDVRLSVPLFVRLTVRPQYCVKLLNTSSNFYTVG